MKKFSNICQIYIPSLTTIVYANDSIKNLPSWIFIVCTNGYIYVLPIGTFYI